MSKKCHGICDRSWDKYFILTNGQVYCSGCMEHVRNYYYEEREKVRQRNQEIERRIDEINGEIKDIELQILKIKDTPEYKDYWGRLQYGDNNARAPLDYDMLLIKKSNLEEEKRNLRYVSYPENPTENAKWYSGVKALLLEQRERKELEKAKELLEKAKKQVIYETHKSMFREIEELIEKATSESLKQAIKQFEQARTWKTNGGNTFTATLSNHDLILTQCEKIEKQEEKRKQEEERKRKEEEQRKQEAERIEQKKEMKMKIIIVGTIIVIAIIIFGLNFLYNKYFPAKNETTITTPSSSNFPNKERITKLIKDYYDFVKDEKYDEFGSLFVDKVNNYLDLYEKIERIALVNELKEKGRFKNFPDLEFDRESLVIFSLLNNESVLITYNVVISQRSNDNSIKQNNKRMWIVLNNKYQIVSIY